MKINKLITTLACLVAVVILFLSLNKKRDFIPTSSYNINNESAYQISITKENGQSFTQYTPPQKEFNFKPNNFPELEIRIPTTVTTTSSMVDCNIQKSIPIGSPVLTTIWAAYGGGYGPVFSINISGTQFITNDTYVDAGDDFKQFELCSSNLNSLITIEKIEPLSYIKMRQEREGIAKSDLKDTDLSLGGKIFQTKSVSYDAKMEYHIFKNNYYYIFTIVTPKNIDGFDQASVQQFETYVLDNMSFDI